jgi:hypothetical protein
MTFSRSSEKLTARRAKERKEQYKQVRAHVKKDDGRLQVCYRLHTVQYMKNREQFFGQNVVRIWINSYLNVFFLLERNQEISDLKQKS